MARADLLVSLARAGTSGDRALFRKTLEAIAAEERGKQHHVLAERLEGLLSKGDAVEPPRRLVNGTTIQDMLYETTPRKKLSDLVLPRLVQQVCAELAEEQQRSELLRSHSLEPRHRILLVGSPGNGKTSLAEALAEAMVLPLLTVRYEGLIGSFLGETAGRLRRLFDFVRTRQCILFFDEFDTLGKERGDPHDTGEIKRVVSSLLLQIDDLPSHVVVVTATNHAELLDRAVWRRFQVRLSLPKPTKTQVRQWVARTQEQIGVSFECSLDTIAGELVGASFGELEDFSQDVCRRLVLAGPDARPREIVRDRLAQWSSRRKARRQK